ncbi:zinc finger protein 362a isoform X3 [Nothobranchius furzeri]|uniref:zinc finger protein 362a isoform X3 n=1 Tax=Nothobranchius furzeri TaxID=105023 RepID=UPI0039049F56
MAESRFNNPYFWPPPPAMSGQLDNLVLINKIKEQLMAEKIRPPHLTSSAASQQPLLSPLGQAEGHQNGISKPQQMSALHSPGASQPDVALHARPASSSVTGRILGDVNLNLDDKAAIKARGLWEDWHLRQLMDHPSRTNHVSGVALASRTGNLSSSEIITPTTPTSSSHSRLGGAPTPHFISGVEPGKNNCGGLVGLLGPPPKLERGRKKIKAENGSSLLVVPYPILASGNEQSCVTITAKQTKTYRIHTGERPYKCAHPGCEKAFTQLSNLQSHQRQHNKDKPFKCSNCFRAYSDSASLQIHLSAHAIKNAKAYCCSLCGRAYTSETYLMKHMSKHAMVEHVVSHHSPPHRTDSPNIPLRISFI